MHSHIIVLWLWYFRHTKAIEMKDYWSDHKLLRPITDPINAKSIPSCIHRCSILKNCNIVAVSSYSMTSYSCLHGWMECYEKYNDRIIAAKGWDVNSLNQVFNIATPNCLTSKNYHGLGADVAISTTCNKMSVFREVYRAVKQVETMWHMHPYTSHENPPEGTKVVVWSSGSYWFYFDYKKEFL